RQSISWFARKMLGFIASRNKNGRGCPPRPATALSDSFFAASTRSRTRRGLHRGDDGDGGDRSRDHKIPGTNGPDTSGSTRLAEPNRRRMWHRTWYTDTSTGKRPHSRRRNRAKL